MKNQKRRKYRKIVMIDLNDRKNIEFIKITESERALLNAEYNKEFEEINKKINNKTKDYVNNLEEILKYKLSIDSSNTSSINISDLLLEYDYITKSQSYNEKRILEFNEFYCSLLKKIQS